MHHMDAYKTYEEKARWELHKNARCLEQIQVAAPHSATYLSFHKPFT